MAKIQVTGKSLLIKSSIKYKDYELLSQMSPKSLRLEKEDGSAYFLTAYRPGVEANFIPSDVGIVFDGLVDGKYLAQTVMLAGYLDDTDESKEVVAKNYATLLSHLEAIEKQVKADVKVVKEQLAKTMENITIN